MKKKNNANVNNLWITSIYCEYSKNPIGIDEKTPRFSWVLNGSKRREKQTAYQILISQNQDNLNNDIGDYWDSQKVHSNNSVNILYNGKQLESSTRYYWKVRVWDSEDTQSSFSDVGFFEMGLLKKEDWKSNWIGCQAAKWGEGLLFRREFRISKSIKEARVYIAVLGYYELHINGSRVGDHVLDPGWTESTKTILYVTYDVTNYLRKDKNVIGVIIGNGWYGSPQLRFQMNIVHKDGTSMIVDHGNWDWWVASGPIIKNSIYDGEIYDARLEKPGWDTLSYKVNTVDWLHAHHLKHPGGIMRAQMLEPIKVIEEISPVQITSPKSGIYVFDIGQNIVGWGRLKVKGPSGTKVILKFAEVLKEDGTINQENLRTARAKNLYILRGDGLESYEPHFTYFGFRYVQVEGFPGVPTLNDLQGCVVRSAVQKVGSFNCSNNLLNKIHSNVVWTESGNMHSVPTDCPQRNERMGWLQDVTVRAEESIYNFNMIKFYSKWLRDIKDAQDETSGSIPDTAPYRWGSDPGDPTNCFIFLAWYLYLYYGDRRIVEEYYNNFRKWVEFLSTVAKDDIIPYTRCGDWCPPVADCLPADGSQNSIENEGALYFVGSYPAKTPGTMVSTIYYYYNCFILSKIAKIIGKNKDRIHYEKLAETIKESINTKFLNKKTSNYAKGGQGANTLPLYFNIVPQKNKEELVQNIIDDIMITHNGHLNTGVHSTKYIMEVLTELGKGDIAYTIATQKSYPSWGYMISEGATTIWERWELMSGAGMNSHNHPMFCSIGSWFYKYLAGIQINHEKPGWEYFIVKPHVLGDLSFVHASIKTIRGIVSSKWKKSIANFTLEITVPVNTLAHVYCPSFNWRDFIIYENETEVWNKNIYIEGVDGISHAKKNNEYIMFQVGSGEYSFKVIKKDGN